MSSSTVLLDSSCWIEIFNSGALSKLCERELKAASQVIVPTLVLFEVYRKILASASEDVALSAVAHIVQNEVSDLSQEVALLAADLSLQYKLAAADSIVLAHAHAQGSDCMLLTLDNDFDSLPQAKVLRR